MTIKCKVKLNEAYIHGEDKLAEDVAKEAEERGLHVDITARKAHEVTEVFLADNKVELNAKTEALVANHKDVADAGTKAGKAKKSSKKNAKKAAACIATDGARASGKHNSYFASDMLGMVAGMFGLQAFNQKGTGGLAALPTTIAVEQDRLVSGMAMAIDADAKINNPGFKGLLRSGRQLIKGEDLFDDVYAASATKGSDIGLPYAVKDPSGNNNNLVRFIEGLDDDHKKAIRKNLIQEEGASLEHNKILAEQNSSVEGSIEQALRKSVADVETLNATGIKLNDWVAAIGDEYKTKQELIRQEKIDGGSHGVMNDKLKDLDTQHKALMDIMNTTQGKPVDGVAGTGVQVAGKMANAVQLGNGFITELMSLGDGFAFGGLKFAANLIRAFKGLPSYYEKVGIYKGNHYKYNRVLSAADESASSSGVLHAARIADATTRTVSGEVAAKNFNDRAAALTATEQLRSVSDDAIKTTGMSENLQGFLRDNKHLSDEDLFNKVAQDEDMVREFRNAHSSLFDKLRLQLRPGQNVSGLQKGIMPLFTRYLAYTLGGYNKYIVGNYEENGLKGVATYAAIATLTTVAIAQAEIFAREETAKLSGNRKALRKIRKRKANLFALQKGLRYSSGLGFPLDNIQKLAALTYALSIDEKPKKGSPLNLLFPYGYNKKYAIPGFGDSAFSAGETMINGVVGAITASTAPGSKERARALGDFLKVLPAANSVHMTLIRDWMTR